MQLRKSGKSLRQLPSAVLPGVRPTDDRSTKTEGNRKGNARGDIEVGLSEVGIVQQKHPYVDSVQDILSEGALINTLLT